jgi:Na+-translocating ferredoxin:NAD+ oxidoreductase RnfD subunit
LAGGQEVSASTTTADTIATLQFYPKRSALRRYFALWYFTTLLVVWNVLGHLFLGFEQSHIQPLVGIATAVILQFLLEWVDARASNRKLRFAGSWADLLNFLPPAIIPGLAVPMLLYPNERLMPVIFGVGLAICSKVMFRAPVSDGKTQHMFNPSNLGIVATLLLFPSIGVAAPYHFTENLVGIWHWALPGLVLATGIVVHALFTGRLTLVLTWLVAFVIQGQLRSWYFGTSWIVPLTPMTSAAFMVFTLYMIPDPATTPVKPLRQALFGIAIAAVYGMLLVVHVVYGLFIGLAIVCGLRGLGLYAGAAWQFIRANQRGSLMAQVPDRRAGTGIQGV